MEVPSELEEEEDEDELKMDKDNDDTQFPVDMVMNTLLDYKQRNLNICILSYIQSGRIWVRG